MKLHQEVPVCAGALSPFIHVYKILRELSISTSMMMILWLGWVIPSYGGMLNYHAEISCYLQLTLK